MVAGALLARKSRLVVDVSARRRPTHAPGVLLSRVLVSPLDAGVGTLSERPPQQGVSENVSRPSRVV